MAKRTPHEELLTALGELIENASTKDVARLDNALAAYKRNDPRAVMALRNSGLGSAVFEVLEDSVGYVAAMHKEDEK
jgi:hypothetical protein